jgi:glycosyltransferase involved in cell wall biosynthesis
VIHNGVPVAAFATRAGAARRRRQTSHFRIGMVARLEAHKDQPTLIRAVRRLRRRPLDCEVWLVGEGSRRRELAALIADQCVGDRIRLLGMRRDVPELVGQMDLFVFAATPDEGLGIALIEAMAAGVPVVASDVGACREVLDDGALGLLVPPGDPVALADAIERVRDDPQAAAERAARARRKAFEVFDAARMAAAYAEVLGLKADGAASLLEAA